jgi:GNAT superfamily N-acetyltransferase
LNLDQLTFREAQRDDLPAIIAMLAEDQLGAAREDASMPLDQGYERAFRAIAADSNQLLVVAELEGMVIGTLQITFIPGLSHRGATRGQIEAVRVAASKRGRGVGERLIGYAIERCRERSCRMVELTTNNARTDAHRFYARLGFAQSHKGFKLKLEPDQS